MGKSHFNQLLEKYKGITVKESVINEIGDGNINYVYRVKDQGNSIIIKEAKNIVRSSKRELNVNRLKIEHDSLKFFRQFTPHLIPELYEYDAENSFMVMEDLEGYRTLRSVLEENEENIIQTEHIEQINDFFVEALLGSTSLMMGYQEKRKLECEFNNPEMCDISERLVFTYPYTNHPSNTHTAAAESSIQELITDTRIIDEVLRLKHQFINDKEGLIHGDLHSGSIFIKDNRIKILDSEFALFGPIAYDIGNVIAHLLISKIGKSDEYSNSMDHHINNLMKIFEEKGIAHISKNTKDEFMSQSYLEGYFKGIISDSYKYAGLEIIRRTIGTAKTSEFEQVDAEAKSEVEKQYMSLGKKLLLNGNFSE